MADESTTTTMASVLNPEYIGPLLDYAMDSFVATPHVNVLNLAGRGTKVASWPKVTKDTISATTAEATDASNTALDYTDVTATVAENVIVRDITKLARRSSIFGEDELMRWIVEEGARLVYEKIEDDVIAVFASASTSVGNSGQPLTLSDYASALSKLAIAKAFGRAVFVLSGTQQSNLRNAVVTGGAAFLGSGAGNGILAQANEDGYVGSLMNADSWVSNLCDASGVNTIGACMVSGALKPAQAAIGLAVLWWPEVEMLTNPSLRSEEVAISSAHAATEILDYAYVKIVTIT